MTAIIFLLSIGITAVVSALGGWLTAGLIVAAAMPLLVDLGLLVARPIEASLAERYRRQAEKKLRRIDPFVIAVTGSWGKTSTKNHIRDLMANRVDVVASPASWNNLAGLSRTINEYLTESTEVLVAEMGMYGPGEIRALCSWMRPRIAVICAVGPMHLERVGSLDGIAGAKAEIVEACEKAVLWVEDPILEQYAIKVMPSTAAVWRVGRTSSQDLDVAVTRSSESGEIQVWYRGRMICASDALGGLHESNIGCAVAACLAYGLSESEIVKRLDSLTSPSNRGSAGRDDRGVYVLDDTFNSNPVGASTALARLSREVNGRKVLATPGMVELGSIQNEANRQLAEEARGLGVDVLVIGWTNREPLRVGAGSNVFCVRDRAAAVRWVRENLHEGDGVLWENDLPDHYP
ncbi:MAG: Mur ligase family protein [Acidimicrobiales bacterium]